MLARLALASLVVVAACDEAEIIPPRPPDTAYDCHCRCAPYTPPDEPDVVECTMDLREPALAVA